MIYLPFSEYASDWGTTITNHRVGLLELRSRRRSEYQLLEALAGANKSETETLWLAAQVRGDVAPVRVVALRTETSPELSVIDFGSSDRTSPSDRQKGSALQMRRCSDLSSSSPACSFPFCISRILQVLVRLVSSPDLSKSDTIVQRDTIKLQ